MTAATRPRQRMAREDRRTQLLAAAEKLVGKVGAANLTMEGLSAGAGVSKPVVYSHFDSKTALLLALLEDYWQHLDATSDRLTADVDDDDFMASLRVATHAYFVAIEERGAVMRTMLTEMSSDADVEAVRQARIRDVTRRWSETGQRVGLDKKVADTLAIAMRSSLEGLSRHWLDSPADRDLIEDSYCTIVEASLHALRDAKPTAKRARVATGSRAR